MCVGGGGGGRGGLGSARFVFKWLFCCIYNRFSYSVLLDPFTLKKKKIML